MKLSAFQRGYVTAALWSSTDDNGKPLDSGDFSLTENALAALVDQAERFQSGTRSVLDQANEMGRDDEHLGHDFWLSRNRHGTGFWDRGLGAVGQELHHLAGMAGGVDLIVDGDLIVGTM